MVPPLDLDTAAVPPNVGVLRRALRRWLLEVLDDGDVVDDLVLAASEAFENATDHAYARRTAPGTMRLHAEVVAGAAERSLVIRIEDDGDWRPPSASTGGRGRGIIMMEKLAESAVVEPRPVGTAVTLTQSLV